MSISYEQVNLNDRFGQVMLNNLTSRGCGLAGYDACESVQTQQERFLNCGFQESKCELMSDIYESLPGRTDIEKLEFLDDVDIFKQLLQHYSITTSSNSAIFDAIVCKFYSLDCPRPKMGWVDPFCPRVTMMNQWSETWGDYPFFVLLGRILDSSRIWRPI